MKKAIFLGLVLLIPVLVYSQNGGIRILPEAGISLPLGDFKETNVFAGQGYQAGLHLDKMWGAFGLGLYGGITRNPFDFTDPLAGITLGPTISEKENAIQNYWQQYRAGLGPVLSLRLSERVHIDLTSKLGMARFSYPDFGKLVEVGDPLNQTFSLFQTKNETLEKQFNPMAFSELRLRFQLSKRIDLSLAGNYLHVRNVYHAYSYLDAGLRAGMTEEELVQALRTAPTFTEVRRCHFNLVGATLGLSFNLGGKPDEEEPGKIDPPVPEYPADGATITTQEADSLTLKWRKESPGVEGANYYLWLYKVSESSDRPDSLLYKTKVKKELQLELPEEVKLEAGNTYRWKVQAVDDRRLKACPVGCYSEEATFEVSSALSNQFYHLITQNSGNYVAVRSQLRFILPKNFEMGGKVDAGIMNQDNEEVERLEDLAPGKKGENYTVDAEGIVAIDLKRLAEGYYLLELKNERNKTYYLRFTNVKNNEPIKN